MQGSQVTITIPSNRIYMDTLSMGEQSALMLHRKVYSAAKEKLYNIRYDQTYLTPDEQKHRGTPEKGKDTAFIKDWIAEKFGLHPQEYHITSLFSHANGMLAAQKELVGLRVKEHNARLSNREGRIRDTSREFKKLCTIKKKLVARSKAVRGGKKASVVKLPAPHLKKFGQPVTDKEYYLYEVWLDRKIRGLKTRAALLTNRQDHEKRKDMSVPARITFGGRKLYRLKDTTDMDRSEWHALREQSRTHMVLFSGRYDAKYKNWLCKYEPKAKEFSMSLIDGTVIRLSDVRFPYRGDNLETVLSHPKEKGWSVGYWLDFRKDHSGREYFLIKASFTMHDERLNTDVSDGIISIDLNADNVSWSELDGDGCRLDGGMVMFDIRGKSSTQADDILGRVSAKIAAICRSKMKPLAMEDIDTSLTRNRMEYGSRKANRMASLFAYRKLTQLITGKLFRNGTGVIKVNPAYTSLIGKLKYMRHYRIPVHMAASYVIGRRAMGFSEKVPAYLKMLVPEDRKHRHYWAQFASLQPVCKSIPPVIFLNRQKDFTDIKELKALVPSYT